LQHAQGIFEYSYAGKSKFALYGLAAMWLPTLGTASMEKLLSPKQLADALGIAEQTIYNRHSKGGNLPPLLKVGNLLRFKPSEVDAWLEAQRCNGRVVRKPKAGHTSRRPGRPTKAEQMAKLKF